MSRHKFARPAIGAVAILVAAALAVPALAAAPKTAQVNTVGGAKMVPNRSITDAMHFKQDVVTVQTGGKIKLGDRTKAPHSCLVVKRGQVPAEHQAGGRLLRQGARATSSQSRTAPSTPIPVRSRIRPRRS